MGEKCRPLEPDGAPQVLPCLSLLQKFRIPEPAERPWWNMGFGVRTLLQIAGLQSWLYLPSKGFVPWFSPLCSGTELVPTSESFCWCMLSNYNYAWHTRMRYVLARIIIIIVGVSQLD